MSKKIIIPESPRADVYGISLRMHCRKCGRIWEELIPVDEPLFYGWDMCRQCLVYEQDAWSREVSNNEHTVYTSATQETVSQPPFMHREAIENDQDNRPSGT